MDAMANYQEAAYERLCRQPPSPLPPGSKPVLRIQQRLNLCLFPQSCLPSWASYELSASQGNKVASHGLGMASQGSKWRHRGLMVASQGFKLASHRFKMASLVFRWRHRCCSCTFSAIAKRQRPVFLIAEPVEGSHFSRLLLHQSHFFFRKRMASEGFKVDSRGSKWHVAVQGGVGKQEVRILSPLVICRPLLVVAFA